MDYLFVLLGFFTSLSAMAVGFLFGWWAHKHITAKYLHYLITVIPGLDERNLFYNTVRLFADLLQRQWSFPWQRIRK